MVARPLMNRELDTSRAVSAGLRPATPAMMNGTAMTPPNIDRMCWMP